MEGESEQERIKRRVKGGGRERGAGDVCVKGIGREGGREGGSEGDRKGKREGGREGGREGEHVRVHAKGGETKKEGTREEASGMYVQVPSKSQTCLAQAAPQCLSSGGPACQSRCHGCARVVPAKY